MDIANGLSYKILHEALFMGQYVSNFLNARPESYSLPFPCAYCAIAAVRVDHLVPGEVEGFVRRIEREQGRLVLEVTDGMEEYNRNEYRLNSPQTMKILP